MPTTDSTSEGQTSANHGFNASIDVACDIRTQLLPPAPHQRSVSSTRSASCQKRTRDDHAERLLLALLELPARSRSWSAFIQLIRIRGRTSPLSPSAPHSRLERARPCSWI